MVISSDDLGRIGQLGFHTWFDKQLRDSNLWLMASFAVLILLMIVFGLLTGGDPVALFQWKALLVVLGLGIAWFAYRRYARAIAMADALSRMRLCPACKYPSFSVVKREMPGLSGLPTRLVHDLDDDGLLVSCRRCHHKWRWGYASDEATSAS